MVAPLDGSPAQRAGIKAGDLILKVDDRDIGGLSLEEVVRRIKGPAGISVNLTVLSQKTGGGLGSQDHSIPHSASHCHVGYIAGDNQLLHAIKVLTLQ